MSSGYRNAISLIAGSYYLAFLGLAWWLGELNTIWSYPFATIFYSTVPLLPLAALVWTVQRARGWPVKVASGLVLLSVIVGIVRIAAFFLAIEDEWVLVSLVILGGWECIAVLVFLTAWLGFAHLRPKRRVG